MWYLFSFLCAAVGAGLNASDGNWGWATFCALLAIGNLALLISDECS